MAPDTGALPAGQSPAGLVSEVGRALGRLGDGAAAVVALSGGPDSVALTELAVRARPDLRLMLAYVDHGLRDDTADREVVRGHADRLDLPLAIRPVRLRPDGRGPEAAARSARYDALREVADEAGAARILVGHTADDQAETVLLRLARGTGVAGLAAMTPVRDDLLRPLLRLRRADVRGLVADEELAAVTDPANADRRLRRVRARRELLPALERLGADAVGAVTRLAELARRDEEVLDREAGAWSRRIVRRTGPVAAIDADALDGLPVALSARVLRRVHAQLRPGADPLAADHVDSALALSAGAAVDLPGLRATRGGGWLALGPRDPTGPSAQALPVPGRIAWPVPAVVVAAGRSASPPRPAAPVELPPGWDRRLTHAGLVLPAGELTVRPRRPGDRVTTGGGTRKLADIMVDAGLPRPLRPLVPVVCVDDEPVWVPGLAVDATLAIPDRPGGRDPGGAGRPTHLVVGSPPDERRR